MTPPSLSPAPYADIFTGNSDMADAMRRHDWSSTSLGPPDRWPEALKVALRILLTSRFEMWIGWGPDVVFFYNDAYRPTLGDKAANALGRPTREVWSEIWADVRHRVELVYEKGEATWDRALPLLVQRSGYLEETYHTFSYSPLLGEHGRVEGLFCAVTEETDRVISERHLASLRELSASLAVADTRHAVLAAAGASLAGATHDLPFVLVYLFDAAGPARLAFAIGVASGAGMAPTEVVPGSGHDLWGASLLLAGEAEVPTSLDGLPGVLPAVAWPVAPTTALAVPLAASGGGRPTGFLVAGLNPYRRLDGAYRSFIDLVTGQIAARLASADAYDAERRRSAALVEAARLRQAADDALRRANENLAAEVQARTAESERLRGLFQQAPGFMCVFHGPQHVYELVNDACLQLVGHRNILGKPIREALPELEGQGYYELLDGVLATGETFNGRALRASLQREPGHALEERFITFVFQPIRGADGTPTGVFCEGSDVTEQVRAEQALIALNETLESRIADRTHALEDALARLRSESVGRENAQAALRQSQKMEAVGQLTGAIAHDFNNLLQGITGSLELLKRRAAQGRTEGAARYIDEALQSAHRAASLTHRLLAFSRRQPIDPKPVQANQLIASMEDMLRRTLGERIALRLDLDPGLWTTRCDAHQLESALLNLCINARDAMPDGGSLTVATGNLLLGVADAARVGEIAAGEYVAIAVVDTGTGMTPEVALRAFDPFFTTKPLGHGTGLGLSMIYGFTRQSEGAAQIDSAPGRGTTVRLYLPRQSEGTSADAPRGAADPKAAAERAREAAGTVLVIEDEATVRSLVVEILQELGYATIEAVDGPSGLEVLAGPRKIDLLVTDIGLPGMDGRQVVDASRHRRPGLKVLFMTGYAQNAAAAAGFLEPGMEMITKPFSVDVLADTLQRLLKRNG